MIGFRMRDILLLVFKEIYPELIFITLLLLLLSSRLFNIGIH